jgi:hypothetical protein
MSATDAFEAARHVCESLQGLPESEKVIAIRMALVFLGIGDDLATATKVSKT